MVCLPRPAFPSGSSQLCPSLLFSLYGAVESHTSRHQNDLALQTRDILRRLKRRSDTHFTKPVLAQFRNKKLGYYNCNENKILRYLLPYI